MLLRPTKWSLATWGEGGGTSNHAVYKIVNAANGRHRSNPLTAAKFGAFTKHCNHLDAFGGRDGDDVGNDLMFIHGGRTLGRITNGRVERCVWPCDDQTFGWTNRETGTVDGRSDQQCHVTVVKSAGPVENDTDSRCDCVTSTGTRNNAGNIETDYRRYNALSPFSRTVVETTDKKRKTLRVANFNIRYRKIIS